MNGWDFGLNEDDERVINYVILIFKERELT
jgi:hypothetical protein